MKTKNNLSQEGGNHYERLKIEPVKVFVAFNFNWFQAEILKYVSRFQYKNGEKDLNKAIHVSDMAIDLNVLNNSKKKDVVFRKLIIQRRYLSDMVNDYCSQFEYEEYMTILMIGIVEQNYQFLKEQISNLKKKYYG